MFKSMSCYVLNPHVAQAVKHGHVCPIVFEDWSSITDIKNQKQCRHKHTHTHQNIILQFVYYIYTHIYIFTSISIYLRVHSKTLVVTHAHAFVNMTQGGEVVFASTSHIDMMIASLVLKNMFVLCVPLL